MSPPRPRVIRPLQRSATSSLPGRRLRDVPTSDPHSLRECPAPGLRSPCWPYGPGHRWRPGHRPGPGSFGARSAPNDARGRHPCPRLPCGLGHTLRVQDLVHGVPSFDCQRSPRRGCTRNRDGGLVAKQPCTWGARSALCVRGRRVWRPVEPDVPSRRRTCPASPPRSRTSGEASLPTGITRGHKPSSRLRRCGSATVTRTRDPLPIRLVTRNRRRGIDISQSNGRSTLGQDIQTNPEHSSGAKPRCVSARIMARAVRPKY